MWAEGWALSSKEKEKALLEAIGQYAITSAMNVNLLNDMEIWTAPLFGKLWIFQSDSFIRNALNNIYAAKFTDFGTTACHGMVRTAPRKCILISVNFI